MFWKALLAWMALDGSLLSGMKGVAVALLSIIAQPPGIVLVSLEWDGVASLESVAFAACLLFPVCAAIKFALKVRLRG